MRQRGFASARKVFDVAELLEKILLEVDDIRTVLLAQRVDTMFQGVIRGLVRLQDKLWLPSVFKNAISDLSKTTSTHPVSTSIHVSREYDSQALASCYLVSSIRRCRPRMVCAHVLCRTIADRCSPLVVHHAH